jgi:hypothetical protein
VSGVVLLGADQQIAKPVLQRGGVMKIGFFDEVKVVRINDEDQLAELEFAEAQEKFCSTACRWHDTKEPKAMEAMVECEVKLLNVFMAGSDKPIILRAWAAYRRRLLFHHRKES